jgi:hypothetical protein
MRYQTIICSADTAFQAKRLKRRLGGTALAHGPSRGILKSTFILMWLITPQQRHVIFFQIPGDKKKNCHTRQCPEKQANRQCMRKRFGLRASLRLSLKEHSAGKTETGRKRNPEQGICKAILPAASRYEESAGHQGTKRQNAHEEGKRSADFQKHRLVSCAYPLIPFNAG